MFGHGPTGSVGGSLGKDSKDIWGWWGTPPPPMVSPCPLNIYIDSLLRTFMANDIKFGSKDFKQIACWWFSETCGYERASRNASDPDLSKKLNWEINCLISDFNPQRLQNVSLVAQLTIQSDSCFMGNITFSENFKSQVIFDWLPSGWFSL